MTRGELLELVSKPSNMVGRGFIVNAGKKSEGFYFVTKYEAATEQIYVKYRTDGGLEESHWSLALVRKYLLESVDVPACPTFIGWRLFNE